jgi:hypothetical protein
MGRAGAYRAAIEGIRAAQLSGFLICAKVEMCAKQSAEFAELCAELESLDLDGMLIAGPEVSAANSGWHSFLSAVESARLAHLSQSAERAVEGQLAVATEANCEEVSQVP